MKVLVALGVFVILLIIIYRWKRRFRNTNPSTIRLIRKQRVDFRRAMKNKRRAEISEGD